MNITGKCKKEFEKWIGYNYIIDGKIQSLKVFYGLPKSMQYCVYLDYFDSVGVYIYIDIYEFPELISKKEFSPKVNYICVSDEKEKLTRPEAREKAINKANEIRNEQLPCKHLNTEKWGNGIKCIDCGKSF